MLDQQYAELHREHVQLNQMYAVLEERAGGLARKKDEPKKKSKALK